MALPTCECVAGLPQNEQVDAIYCAAFAYANDSELVDCECAAGYVPLAKWDLIYCALWSLSEDLDLPTCECVAGFPLSGKYAAVYCALWVLTEDPSLPACDCVEGLPQFSQLDAIYCAARALSNDESLPTCSCIEGVPLGDKFAYIFCAIAATINPTELATLRVAWDESAGAVDGYRVEYSVDNVNWTVAGEVGPLILTFSIQDLEWDFPYYARVFSFNGSGDSPASNTLLLWTATQFGPTDCIATTIDDQSILVDYLDSVTQPSNGGYRVRWKKSDEILYDPNDYFDNAIGEQQGTASGLDPDTSYDFKVVTFNDNSANTPPQVDSESVSSNESTAVTTPEQIAPTMVSAVSNVSGTQVTLTASENCNIGGGGNGGLASTGRTWTYVSGFTGTLTAIYGVSPAIAFGDVVTLNYTQPGDGVQDLVGNDMATFVNLAVTNNVPQPYFLNENFEQAGNVAPTGWATANTGTITWNDSVAPAPLQGNQSLRILVASQARTATSPSFGPKTSGDFYFMFNFPVLPAVGKVFWRLLASNGTTVLASLTVGTSNAITLTVGATTITTTTTLSASTTYHVWVYYAKGTGANAQGTVGFSTDGIRPVSGNSFRSIANGNATGDADLVRFGPENNSTWTAVIDRVIGSDTTIGNNP